MSSRFEDDRGVIQDWFGPDEPIDSVTYITTVKDAIRGNHYHEHTWQWTLVLSGRLLMASGYTENEMGAGMMVTHPPGDHHAWKALEDSECVVFTRGPRSGENYEADTHRLEKPLL